MKILSGIPFRHNFFIFLLGTLICYGYANFVRFEQYQTWENNSAQYFFKIEPMMTTLDSYYWLRWARAYQEGREFGVKDSLRGYPDDRHKRPDSVPPISYLITETASILDTSHYKAGLILTSALSGLFIFPLAIYFFLIGYPLAGLLGGMIGAVSLEYLIRTGIGRVDTDVLMLFFPFLASLLILCASKSYTLFSRLAFSGLAGGTIYLLFLWAPAGATFVAPFAAVLFLSLLAGRPEQSANTQSSNHSMATRFPLISKVIVTLFCLIIYLAFASGFDQSVIGTNLQQSALGRINYYLSTYVPRIDGIKIPGFDDPRINRGEISGTIKKQISASTIVFPSSLQTITETKALSLNKALGLTLTSPLLSAIGLSACLVFFITHWRKLLPILPILFVGLLAFQGARRLALFLGPFVGIGYGYLVTIFLASACRYFPFIFRRQLLFFKTRFSESNHSFSAIPGNLLKDFSGYAVAAGLFFTLSSATVVGIVPKPSVPVQNYASFLYLKENLPPKSAIYTWWDYGYALTEVTGQATFHDGGSQMTPKTFFIAQSIVSDNQQQLYNTISYLASEGLEGIIDLMKDNTSYGEILSNVLVTPPPLKQDNVFVVFTRDMIRKYRAINSIGKWEVTDKNLKPRQGYKILNCSRLQSYKLSCRNGIFDLKTGLTPKGTRLKEVVLIDDGNVKRRMRYPHKNGMYLQILISGSRLIRVHLVSEEVYQSNFNQMFLLGQYDKNLFEQYYNAFPWTRVFRVKSHTQRDIDAASKSH